MKKILLLCDYFLPSVRAGGTVRSIAAFVNCLKTDFDITVVTRNHDLSVSEPFKEIHSDQPQQCDGYQILYLSSRHIIPGIYQLIKANHFDIIYLNSFVSLKFSIIPLIITRLLKIKNSRIIISPHGELCSGALSIKPMRKKCYILFFKTFLSKGIEFLSASSSEAKEIKAIHLTQNLTTLPNIPCQKTLTEIINHKKQNAIHIIFLSRISKIKNLLGAIDILSHVKGVVYFDIYGPIEDNAYWEECAQNLRRLPENIHATYKGECDPDNVLNTLKTYDLFFLPTYNENYGYVIVESLASACPVLLSNQTPWHDLSEHHAGWEYPLTQPQLFAEKIDSLIAMNNEAYFLYKQGALNYYQNHIVNNFLADDYRTFFTRSQ